MYTKIKNAVFAKPTLQQEIEDKITSLKREYVALSLEAVELQGKSRTKQTEADAVQEQISCLNLLKTKA